jgi:hypothetical protein
VKKNCNWFGWFSIGLGLAELSGPRQLANFIGLEDKDHRQTVLRLYGLREATAEVGIGFVPSMESGDVLGHAAPEAYKMFRDKQDECIKVVLSPQLN